MRVTAMQGDTLDALCHRHLGVTAGVVEKALELNPGIAHLGPVLPHGTSIVLPTITTATAPPQRAAVKLWD